MEGALRFSLDYSDNSVHRMITVPYKILVHYFKSILVKASLLPRN